MTTISLPALPEASRKLIENVGSAQRHPGLQLDKLSCAAKQEHQGPSIDAATSCEGDQKLLDELRERRERLLDAVGAVRFHCKAIGPVTLHLARANAMENSGLALHPIYGFAWLPGTGLKGMTRAWAETVRVPCQSDSESAWTRFRAAFGTASSHGTISKAGRIVFHDAWPVRWPRLGRDIVNPHHTKYYQEKQPPGDWEDPVPSSFVVIEAGSEFDFAVSDRLPAGDGLLEETARWMQEALEHAGAGAKTAAGYGRFVPARAARSSPSPKPPELPDTHLRREHVLTLVSPAFLAGARRKQADCDLRPATLRGLLRWWWRTMHANHLDAENLGHLEAAVWGDTSRSSAVALSLVARTENSQAAEYRKRDIVDRIGNPAKSGRGQKTVRGLYYVSYGMDERNSSRHFLQPENSWTLALTARETSWRASVEKEKKDDREAPRLPAQAIMRQAEAALWLLIRFGGAGSKTRNGFGSFADISTEGISSIDDCIEAGRELRDACGLAGDAGGGAKTPSLEARVGPVEIPTRLKDPWETLDRVGEVYQGFVKSVQAQKRIALGLPRARLKGPNGETRHSSPAHWSLAHGEDGNLAVRLIGFPSDRLPNADESRRILRNLARHAETELKNAASTSAGSRNLQRPGVAPPRHALAAGDRVEAELLDEKTRKGGWKARECKTGTAGNIQNSDSVPGDAKPGDRVELIVKIPDPRNAAFDWPTPEIKARQQREGERVRGSRKRRG